MIKLVKVTVEQYYAVPVMLDGRTRINGWSFATLIQDWFTNHGLWQYHATRDSHMLGSMSKVLKTEVVDDFGDIHPTS